MADKKLRKPPAADPRKRGERQNPADAARDAREGDAFVNATHRVIEEEVERGDASPAAEPDQKGEPGAAFRSTRSGEITT
jgi:hypothetical protein